MAKNAKNLNQIPPEIEQYLQALIIEKGADNLPPELLGQIMVDLWDRFQDYLLANFAIAMPKDKFNEFEDLLESETDGRKIEKYLKDNVDFSRIVKQTLDEFRGIFLGNK